MIWHIIKKDCKLLWPVVAGVTAMQFFTLLLFHLYENPSNQINVIKALASLGWLQLAVMAVHQDPIPGVRQDWLVRPIRRPDLLLAKLSFLVLMIHGPYFLVSVADFMTHGITLRESLGLAAGKCILLGAGTLSCLAVGSLFGTLQGMTLGSVGVLVSMIFLTVRGELAYSGLQWLKTAAVSGLVLLAAIAVLPLTYFWRNTKAGMILLAGTIVCAGVGETYVTWPAWFALQQYFSTDPGASRSIVVTAPPDPLLDPRVDRRPKSLPLQITGLPEYARVHADASDVRTYTGATYHFHQPEWLMPPDVHHRAGDWISQQMPPEPGPVKIDLFLTLMRMSAIHVFPVGDPSRRVPGLGQCQASMNPDQTELILSCVNAIRPPCYSAVLDSGPRGMQEFTSSSCRPDYQPFRTWTTFPEDVVQLAVVPASGLHGARVVLKIYEPQDHFTRHLEVQRAGGW